MYTKESINDVLVEELNEYGSVTFWIDSDFRPLLNEDDTLPCDATEVTITSKKELMWYFTKMDTGEWKVPVEGNDDKEIIDVPVEFEAFAMDAYGDDTLRLSNKNAGLYRAFNDYDKVVLGINSGKTDLSRLSDNLEYDYVPKYELSPLELGNVKRLVSMCLRNREIKDDINYFLGGIYRSTNINYLNKVGESIRNSGLTIKEMRLLARDFRIVRRKLRGY